VAAFKKDGADVVYQANIDATQPDMTPDMTARRNAGAEVIVVWSVTTGMEARNVQHPCCDELGRRLCRPPSLASGELAGLVDKPENWKKVTPSATRAAAMTRAGKLPAKSEEPGRSA